MENGEEAGEQGAGSREQGENSSPLHPSPCPSASCAQSPIPADCRQLAQKPSILERSL